MLEQLAVFDVQKELLLLQVALPDCAFVQIVVDIHQQLVNGEWQIVSA